MNLVCKSCAEPLAVGEALVVTPRDGGASYLVHRASSTGAYCFRSAVPLAVSATITLLDPDAAREFDAREARPSPLEREDRYFISRRSHTPVFTRRSDLSADAGRRTQSEQAKETT
jgi:hypothetical protein